MLRSNNIPIVIPVDILILYQIFIGFFPDMKKEIGIAIAKKEKTIWTNTIIPYPLNLRNIVDQLLKVMQKI